MNEIKMFMTEKRLCRRIDLSFFVNKVTLGSSGDIKTCREKRKIQIKKVFEEGELRQETTVAKFATVENQRMNNPHKIS